ncbi:hypothetical protein EG328_004094 [Venturia inaequalis]|uniref:Zn(2)-C6 fungal-type domain-containing protein n=1 Tax=Venturia inaequalis TaxID=5025 RepID=A0A8H3YIU1_VENIN|nr:hypothetical protein EG328_004094 [Venturia inaequalis]
MQKRISHTKSRKGCRNCKKRHVKCDEQGPPCFNCVIRSTTNTCSLPNSASPTPVRQSKTPPVSSSSELLQPPGLPPLTRVVSASAQSRRMLELRLMHRWSTTTYQSFCSTVYDPPWLQSYVPECALEHDYLLYGIFAMSSLDLIIGGSVVDETQTQMYFQAALEYYDKASESFRQQLSNITPTNFHSMYMFAFMAAAMYMARPLCPLEQRNRQPEGVIGRAAVVMKLLMACSGLADQNVGQLLDVNGVSGSSVTTTITAIGNVVRSPQYLGSSTEEALARLRNLIEADAFLNLGRGAFATPSSLTASYQNAVRWLRVSFGMEAKYNETVMGFCLAWPALAGTDFVEAFSKADVMAMLIVMHWAVLLDRLGSLVWWAASMGRDLVREISKAVLQSKAQVAVGPEIHQSIEWARQQVGLTSELEFDFSSVNPSFMGLLGT